MSTNYKSIVLATSLFFALATSISAAPGDLDPTFGNGGKRTDWTGYASGVAIQPDGKIVVAGDGKGCCSPDNDFRVARYNPDGSPDTTFGGGTGRVTTDINGSHDASENVVLQPDGKIIVAGWAVLPNSGAQVSLAVVRYNPDGSLDTTFGGGSGKVLTPPLYFGTGEVNVAIQPDGRILVVLGQYDFNDNDYGLLIRYNADGSPDTSFGMGGSVLSQLPMYSVTVQPADGKIVVNEDKRYGDRSPGIARFNTNGSLDTGFGSGGRVTLPAGFWFSSLAIDSAGKIVAAGRSVTGSTLEFALLRLNVDGSPDSSFDGDGIVTTPSLEIANSVVIQFDGKIVAAGYGPGPGNYDLALARYNSNGSLDNTFGGGDGITTVDFNNSSDFGAAVVLDNQGRAVVVGGTGPVGGANVFAIARFLGDSAPTCPAPIDCPEFFVRQHYLDFLDREPEPSGLAAWLNVLNSCAVGDLICRHEQRLTTSAAFFGSLEFQLKGYFVFRFYRAAFARLPDYSEMSADMKSVTGQTSEDVYARKGMFTNSFVQRSEFVTLFNGLPNADYVAALLGRYNLTSIQTPDPAQPDSSVKVILTQSQLVSQLDAGTLTRAQVLRAVADSDQILQEEFNRAFVAMQYYGYLRRTPEPTGYNSWLNYLNAHPQDFREMVRGFVDSVEYRNRFRQF